MLFQSSVISHQFSRNMVPNIFKNSAQIFLRKQTNILSASFVLMGAVLLSGLLGLIRNRLLGGTFYATERESLDVYLAAFRLPDMIFQLLVMGALSAAFIPVFSSYLEKKESEAWHLASVVITIASTLFVVFGVFIFIFAHPLNRLIAPNFNPQASWLMDQLTRIMIIGQLFFVVSNFYTGILQSYQRFLVTALAPIVYNVGIIVGILFLAPELHIYGPTIGVVIGAFLHLLIQVPVLWRLGYRFRPTWDWRHPGFKRIAKLMWPRTFALAVNQIELTMAVIIGTSLSAGSLAIFYFAQQLGDLPVRLFGQTIGQAALPTLAKETEKDIESFKRVFLESFLQILYFSLPAGVLLIVLRIPVVRIAYGARTFPWEATLLTGKIVAVFAVSIFAQAVIQLLVRGFYALQDTLTPLIISFFSVIISVSLSVWFVFGLGWQIFGLSLAITLASLFQAIVLLVFLDQKTNGFHLKTYVGAFSKMLLASFITGIALWIPMRFLDKFVLDTTRTVQLVLLTLIAAISGLGVYLLLSRIMRIKQQDNFWEIFKRFGAWRRILAESEEVLDAPPISPATPPSEE